VQEGTPNPEVIQSQCLHLEVERALIYDEETGSDSDNATTTTDKLKKTDLEQY
jgi:hypothetical protein